MNGNPSESEGLIIDVPEQLTQARRAAEAGLTMFAAVFWLLALRPVLLLGLWYLGGQVAYTHMVKLEGWNNPGYFAVLGTTAVGLAALLVTWNRLNVWRFRGRDRRRLQRTAGDAEVGAYFGLGPGVVERMRASPHLFVERPERSRVVFTLADGLRVEARHDPVGLPPSALPLSSPVSDVCNRLAAGGLRG